MGFILIMPVIAMLLWLSTGLELSNMVDGIIIPTSLYLEGPMCEAVKQYRELDVWGLISNTRAGGDKVKLAEGKVKAFLDDHIDHPQGVLYIALG